ncbi:hypothetical protein ABT168_08780 [Streptomyces sp. NPDC001793]|uniref:hypothetical protein n=1 Tax=Streptomyces sp. NPDC001793 TaxID=3154657 RepID=UPI003330F74E
MSLGEGHQPRRPARACLHHPRFQTRSGGKLDPHGKARARHYGHGPRLEAAQQAVRQSSEPFAAPYQRS